MANEPVAGSDKPFAEARIVLQLGDDDAKVQARVLNVANNLIKHYGDPERVDIEIVTYDAGISLLHPDSIYADRINSLLVSQVKFIVCMNTVETMTRITGKKPELIPASIPVKTGVAYMVEKAQQGYVVIRP
jgi:intracellular sulfur oxidation DsrE/DsrF family protein